MASDLGICLFLFLFLFFVFGEMKRREKKEKKKKKKKKKDNKKTLVTGFTETHWREDPSCFQNLTLPSEEQVANEASSPSMLTTSQIDPLWGNQKSVCLGFLGLEMSQITILLSLYTQKTNFPSQERRLHTISGYTLPFWRALEGVWLVINLFSEPIEWERGRVLM